MKTTALFAAGVWLLSAAGTAAAQADRGFFATAGVGSSETDFHPSTAAHIDETRSAFDIGFGYAFNPYLSIRAGWHDFRDVTGFVQCPADGCILGESDGCPPGAMCFAFVRPEPVGVDVSGWSARVTASLPFGGRFAAFASIGILGWDTSAPEVVTLPGIGAVDDLDDSGEDLVYDAGLRWHVADRWSVAASYERANVDISSARLGVSFRF